MRKCHHTESWQKKLTQLALNINIIRAAGRTVYVFNTDDYGLFSLFGLTLVGSNKNLHLTNVKASFI